MALVANCWLSGAVKEASGAGADWMVRSTGDGVKFGALQLASRFVGAVAVVSFGVVVLRVTAVVGPLTQLLCFLGRQFVQVFPAFTQAQPLQEPVLLHLQHAILCRAHRLPR